MKFHINSIKTRFFVSLIAASCLLLDAQSLFAAARGTGLGSKLRRLHLLRDGCHYDCDFLFQETRNLA